jgi:hypothetical protein
LGDCEPLEVKKLVLDRCRLTIGDELIYSFELVVKGETPIKVRLDLAVQYARAWGRTTRKIFAISEQVFAPGNYGVVRRLSLADHSTRKHHPGDHCLAIVANGAVMAEAMFDLLPGVQAGSQAVSAPGGG